MSQHQKLYELLPRQNFMSFTYGMLKLQGPKNKLPSTNPLYTFNRTLL